MTAALLKQALEALEPFADLAQESDRLRHGDGSSCMWLIPRCDLVKARDALTSLRALAAEAEVSRLRGLPRVWTADDVRAALLVMHDNARTATEKNMAEQALAALTKGAKK